MTEPIYAIGDIHGQLEALEEALSLIESDGGRDARIVFLGDYTDRGPQSREVLDLLIAGQRAGMDWTFLKGNHDRMFRWFMEETPRHDPHLPIELYWLHPRLGGDATLASYGLEFTPQTRQSLLREWAEEAVPKAHVTFLQETELCHETEGLFFCHAGIRPGVPLEAQSEHDLIWIRQEFHEHQAPHPKLIIHGHTPVKEACHYGNRINLDTGAGYGHPLTTAVFEGTDCWLVTTDGRHPLTPC